MNRAAPGPDPRLGGSPIQLSKVLLEQGQLLLDTWVASTVHTLLAIRARLGTRNVRCPVHRHLEGIRLEHARTGQQRLRTSYA